MTLRDPLLETMWHSPKLGLYLDEIQNRLRAERTQRRKFYAQIHEGEKAEFINGEVIFHSPVRLRHANASELLLMLLKVHVAQHNLGIVGHEKLMVSLTRNDYEPDICFFSTEKAVHFTPDQMRFPAPDFVVEILSPSTAEIDRTIKFEDYAAHHVREYWIIDPQTEFIEQYIRHDATDQYELHHKISEGMIRSVAVIGFHIPVRAVFDAQENLRALQELLKPASN